MDRLANLSFVIVEGCVGQFCRIRSGVKGKCDCILPFSASIFLLQLFLLISKSSGETHHTLTSLPNHCKNCTILVLFSFFLQYHNKSIRNNLLGISVLRVSVILLRLEPKHKTVEDMAWEAKRWIVHAESSIKDHFLLGIALHFIRYTLSNLWWQSWPLEVSSLISKLDL